MELSINSAVLKYNLLNCLKYSDETYNVPRELKVRLIRMKLDLEKIYKEFNLFQQQALEEIKTDRYKYLVDKKDRTPEEEKEVNDLMKELNEDLHKIVREKSLDKVNVNFNYLTEDEFNDILLVNVNNNVRINGMDIASEEYIELFHNEFVR